jgi:UDP-N-acetylmuramyl tripeptide synthase
VLEVAGAAADPTVLGGWAARVARARDWLGWPAAALVARRHASGASLALEAPCDQLFTATELNEWALAATVAELDPLGWATLPAAMLAEALENAAAPATVIAPVLDEAAARERLCLLAAREARAGLAALLARAGALQRVLDDDTLSLGAGVGGADWPLAALPAPDVVPWPRLHGVPTAAVTGSNGKTTTVRLLAACAREAGRIAGYNSTDGVYIGAERVASGDYAGPAGARLVLRDRRTEVAVIETARGGILRRGFAMTAADVAVVTNISADHFGEYGIHDLDGLADVKLAVAQLLGGTSGRDGLLVLNADDERLVARAPRGAPYRLGWFALDADHPRLVAHRATGGATAGVRAGTLLLAWDGREIPLGAIDSMPLTVGGSARYNVANLAAAALAAAALGIEAPTIARVCARFGSAPADNPGRLMRYEVGGIQVLVDYAHNPEGLRGLLAVAEHLRGGRGRLATMVGHAGNRLDDDLRALAAAAAAFHPALVVVKENEGHLRGREPGEIPRLLRAELLRLGLPDAALPMCTTELDAARCALGWARPGDVLALPVHSAQAREAVIAMLEFESRAAARRGARGAPPSLPPRR